MTKTAIAFFLLVVSATASASDADGMTKGVKAATDGRQTPPTLAPVREAPQQTAPQPELREISSDSAGAIEAAISASDDYLTYKRSFVLATTRLVDAGTCTLVELKERGGWAKFQNRPNRPIYFIHCGGVEPSKRIYLDASSGTILR